MSKIVFVIENYYPLLGGVEVLFKQLAENLAKKHDVTIITHRPKNTEKSEVINNVKIKRVTVPTFMSRYFFTFLSFPKIMISSFNADIIHTTTYNGAPPAWLASKMLGKPCIITINEVIDERWSQALKPTSAKIHRLLEKIIVNLNFTKFVCISKATENDLLKVNPSADTTVIYPGIDTEYWNPERYDVQKQKKFTYMFYGRPGITKGLEYLIFAVPKITETIPESVCVAIVSDDEEFKERRQYIKSLIKTENIVLHDPVPKEHLPKYIKLADCIVVPSLTEGFGFTTVEACYMEKSVVATKVGSIPEVIFGKYILVQPGNSFAIAQGVIDVYNGKMTVTPKKDFSIEKSVKNYEEVYQECQKLA